MNYYRRHLGDYAKDTKTLSVYEHGVYTLLIDEYYGQEQPPTDDDVDALLHPVTPKERASVAKVLNRYFKRDGDRWRHSYCDRVIADARAKSEKASASADRRWQNAKSSHSDGNANASPNASQTHGRSHSDGNASHKPIANSQEPIARKRKGKDPAAREIPLPEGFAITPEIRAYAAEHGVARLDERLEHFVNWARSKEHRYVDWTAVFRNALRGDWAKLNGSHGPRGTLPAGDIGSLKLGECR